MEVQVLPVGKRSEEGSRTGEEDEPPKKKARVMLLQVKKKGQLHIAGFMCLHFSTCLFYHTQILKFSSISQ